jgi:GNAT superfamily N-acetyltransferase
MKDAGIEVTRARTQDKDAWVGLWHLWQRHMRGAVPAHVTERTWQRAQEPNGDLLILLAFTNAGEAIGFATMSFTPFAWTGTDIAYLQDLFIRDSARGTGAGQALLQAIYRMADGRGASQVFWMVDATDERLQRFYEQHAIRTPYLRYMRKPWPW